MYSNFEKIIDNHVPPTIFQICESICYTNGTPSRITNIAKNSRETFFDFDYPLSSKVDKEQFEINIINHFLMRRIGQETFTAFRLFLSNKLNEIMPKYNMLFDALDGWELFNSGEITNRTLNTENESTATNESRSNGTNTSDRRYSNMPDNQLSEVRDGNYITDYNYDTNIAENNDSSNASGTSKSSNIERIERTPADKISIYNDFLKEKNNIYTKIYEDLEPCFYGLYE
jgi:hypothetical protein